jgi:hypothetical protein
VGLGGEDDKEKAGGTMEVGLWGRVRSGEGEERESVGWRRGALSGCREKKSKVQNPKAGFLFFFREGGGGPCVKRERFRVFLWFRVFCCSLKLCKTPCKFSPPQCIWLEVHLYRKYLHVLFKEILQ